jgi:FixJ family two-component response regulator
MLAHGRLSKQIAGDIGIAEATVDAPGSYSKPRGPAE